MIILMIVTLLLSLLLAFLLAWRSMIFNNFIFSLFCFLVAAVIFAFRIELAVGPRMILMGTQIMMPSVIVATFAVVVVVVVAIASVTTVALVLVSLLTFLRRAVAVAFAAAVTVAIAAVSAITVAPILDDLSLFTADHVFLDMFEVVDRVIMIRIVIMLPQSWKGLQIKALDFIVVDRRIERQIFESVGDVLETLGEIVNGHLFRLVEPFT